MEVNSGDRLAIVGPTGSGKTLLLRSLALLDPFDAGQIRWHGQEVSRDRIPEFRSHNIFLHQRPALIEATVEENLRQPFSLKIHGGKQFNRQLIVELLDSLGRDESFLARQQRELSGGESQIVAMLRALQLNPEVLLLDEPTSALDSKSTQAVERLINTWVGQQPERRSTVWVTHDRQQVQRVSGQVLEMNAGCLQSRSPA